MLHVVTIPGLPLYGVKRDGSVWSKKCKGPGRLREHREWRRLRPNKNKKTGYWSVHLQTADREVTHLVHKLVAAAFLGPCPEGYEVNHKNADKDDNSADNLEYVTQQRNLEHAWENGLIVIGRPKLTGAQVVDIRCLSALGVSQPRIAVFFGVGQPAVSDITNDRTWKHKGRIDSVRDRRLPEL